jgi:hypothetical protein
MTGKSRVIVLCLLLVLAVLVPPKPVAAADRLPDLGMAQITDLRITRENGRRLLRFSTRIVNVGFGVFEAHGQRPSTTTPEMTVVQRIYNDVGGYTDVSTAARMFFAGDGHNH